jgi:2'-5' RNA ligase
MTDAADRPPSPPLNPILVERAAEASRIEARLDASIAAIARAAEPTTRRLFVAVMLPGPVAAALATVAEGLARRAQAVGVPISWTAPSDYHLTLRYLGPTRIAAEPAVIDAVADAVEGLAPVPLQLAGLGAFDSPDRARVVWAGVTGPGLAELAQRIDAALQAIGVAELARPFAAHITLGRLASERSISDLLNSTSAQVFSKFDLDVVELLESIESKKNFSYRRVRRIPFKTEKSSLQRQSTPLEPAAPTSQRTSHTSLATDTDDGWPRGQGPDLGGE